MISFRKIFADELGRLCPAGEEVVDVISAQYHPGLEREPDESNTVTFDPINGLNVSSWNDSAEQLVGGLTLDTRRGHQAVGLARAFMTGSNLVLTTRRLLVIGHVSSDTTPEVAWEGPLSSIEAITHDPRFPLELCRIRVNCADGSMVRLWCGVLPWAARRFVASFVSTASR
ncbi:hypothetical protein [Tessaracoccus antarcticus]|uniref:Uncharacterized protein n=1 Tax=Tessaracoccus antarcticus TaxID=2479848 RepID=A0A3M0GBD8_9ACTN|nr:hypothetical protein [Tessaracoccus antarcticus]RMB62295.1 hypothetical protein EAX62_06985 [Tessaracoccus antarcticus]